MAAVEANVNALELEKVVSKLQTLFEYDDMFYANIKKRNVEKISHRQMRVPMAISPGGNFGYFNPNGGDLGRGSAPEFDRAVVTAIFVKEAIEYTKLVQWATDDSRKAIMNAVRDYIARATDELRRQLDAQLQGNGTGAIGTITTPTTSGGVDTYVCTTDGFGVRLMRKLQVIQVFDTTLNTLRGSGTITQWDVENLTVQVTPAIAGVVAGDRIVTEGISSPNSIPALYGVAYHDSNASVGTWLGYSRSSTPEIRASRVNGNNNALALPLPRLAINKIGNRIGLNNGFKPVAWMHPCQKQAYEEIGQLVIQIHKQPKDEALDMYFGDKMQMAGAPVREHFNWDMTRIDFIVDEIWGRAEILPVGFYKTDGRNIFEARGASGGVAASEMFYMVTGFQTFLNNPAGASYIDQLAVPAGYR